ncbi:MAG: LysR family transcriptional regulator [Paracoccaceae bacterium]
MTGPRLDIRHLQMIRAIGRTGRVTDASDELGLTPSALSHRIKEAERRLGVPLFERMHKRLRMTAAAEYLAEVSERMLNELKTVEDEVRRMNEEIDHVVRLATQTYSAYHWLPGFLEFLETRAERISLQIMKSPSEDVTPAILNRQVDIAIVPGNLTRPGCAFVPLFTDRLMFICAPEHRLAGKEVIGGADIEGEKFITYSKVPSPDQEFAVIFRPEGRYPRWTATAEPPEAILELVSANRGTSILTEWVLEPLRSSHRIRAIPLGSPTITQSWRCQFRADEPADGPVALVAAALRDWFGKPKGQP